MDEDPQDQHGNAQRETHGRLEHQLPRRRAHPERRDELEREQAADEYPTDAVTAVRWLAPLSQAIARAASGIRAPRSRVLSNASARKRVLAPSRSGLTMRAPRTAA